MTSLMVGNKGFKNVTFERYVLGAILDEVVYAANLRLQTMSRNRYSLERSDYTGGGRGKQGLDLAVMDAFTGQSRPANTCPGGETFLASMALALGPPMSFKVMQVGFIWIRCSSTKALVL